jgi:eukaryotic-like serine/threonine-protein kinase
MSAESNQTPEGGHDAGAGRKRLGFERLRGEFHRLSELAATARTVELELLRRDAPALAAELEALLLHLNVADLTPPSEPALPERMGPFQVLARLGHGGMGEVFLAERREGEFVQRVAVKRIRRVALSEDFVRRFQRERDLLARLDHPHIARLIDAGSDELYGPWFAMDYVEGESLVRYADQRRLDVPARLVLWRQVADAVAYAHRHAIVHRDLKPSNVLVDADGRARLLDFGIAKLVDVELDSSATGAAFTARYASPEQITGEPVSTATDVHGLGLLMYELLTGFPPFREGNDLALRQAIAHTDPPSLLSALPSSNQSVAETLASLRAASLTELRRTLKGDLDAIVGKALRKRPAERYASATEFADDVQRYLEGRPVLVVPATLSYRLSRLVARHRVASATMALAAIGLTTALVVTLYQDQQLRVAHRQAEAENALLLQILQGGDPYHVLGSELRVSDMLEAATRDVLARTDLAPKLSAELLDRLGTSLLGQWRTAAADAAFAGAEAKLDLPGVRDDALRLAVGLRRALTRFELGERVPARAALDALWPQLARASVELRVEALEWRAHMARSSEDFPAALADIEEALSLCGERCGGVVDARTSLQVKRIDLLMRNQRNDEALALAEAEWRRVDALPAEFAAIRVLVGGARASALAFAGHEDAAEAMLDVLLPLAETVYNGRGNRLAQLYSTQEQIQRNRARHRLAAESAARVVALYSATLPDSVYLAFALKIEGLNRRLIGEYAEALPLLERARKMFLQVEGEASSEAAWCGLNAAALRAQQSNSRSDLLILVQKTKHFFATGNHSLRWVSALLLAETAVDLRQLDIAHIWMEHARVETDAMTGRTSAHDNRLEGLALELALAEGQPVRAKIELLAQALHADEGGRRDHARLRTVLASVYPETATCAAARDAWDVIDPKGAAWRAAQRRLPQCRKRLVLLTL